MYTNVDLVITRTARATAESLPLMYTTKVSDVQCCGDVDRQQRQHTTPSILVLNVVCCRCCRSTSQQHCTSLTLVMYISGKLSAVALAVLVIQDRCLYTLCLRKNATTLYCYNFDTREPILIIFGSITTQKVDSQKIVYYLTSCN